MRRIFKNANIVDVFTSSIIKKDILVIDNEIRGLRDNINDEDAIVIDCQNKYISPSFIDSHMHIESTILLPHEFAKIAVLHGTGATVLDPHEIANVCGIEGISFLIKASKNLPMSFYFTAPSCVPATKFDESYSTIDSDKTISILERNEVLGLAEMMNYVGVINNDKDVLNKISNAKKLNKVIDGHAPLLTGHDLDEYIGKGIDSDHECSNINEALEKASKGQWIMIREGTASKNLEALADLFDSDVSHRCLLVTDDIEPSYLISKGHIDTIIRKAIDLGKNPIAAIRMATIQAANRFNLKNVGAIAPGYKANFVIMNDLNKIDITDVYYNGEHIVKDKTLIKKVISNISPDDFSVVKNSINIPNITKESFYIKPKGNKCNVIGIIPKELLTKHLILDLDFTKNNGVDVSRDILKIAVIERHHNLGHISLGFVQGIGLKSGAIASTVSHDSHNVIVIGTNDLDMAIAVNEIKRIGGGNVYIKDSSVVSELALPIAGLMSESDAYSVSENCKNVRESVMKNSANNNIAPFMNMAFLSLPVIPSLKITTKGLIDVNKFEQIDLFVK